MNDCPKCVTVCKQPHCVTHCQAPKPECEPVCEEPRCDWKCIKPNCPKPKCELVCENPNCVPKVECCNCAMGAPVISQPLPFFKETETNKSCCGCNGAPGGSAVAEAPQVVAANPSMFNTMPSSGYINTGRGQFQKFEKSAVIERFSEPVPVGTPQLSGDHHPRSEAFEAGRTSINLDMLHRDSH
jgi:hypothetical protein